MNVQSCAQGLHSERCRYRHVGARPDAYTHVHKGYIAKRVGYWQVEARPVAYTHVESVNFEMGRYRHMDASPDAYTHVRWAYTPKRAGTGTRMHVQTPTHTCSKGTPQKGRVLERGSTFRGVHTRANGVHSKKGR